MSRWAPDNDEGLHAYVVTSRSIWDAAKGNPGYSRIVYTASLAIAKSQYGHTRELHTTVSVRRAVPADVEGLR